MLRPLKGVRRGGWEDGVEAYQLDRSVDGISGVPRNFVRGGGFHQIQLRTEDRENGDLRAVAPYPLVKGSGGSCNMVQEISFHTVKVS